MGFNLWLISTKTKSSQQNKSHFCLFVFFFSCFYPSVGKKCKCFVCSGSTLSYQATIVLRHPTFNYMKETKKKLTEVMIKNPNWQEATSWLFTKGELGWHSGENARLPLM